LRSTLIEQLAGKTRRAELWMEQTPDLERPARREGKGVIRNHDHGTRTGKPLPMMWRELNADI
jgi:hypothetical protein